RKAFSWNPTMATASPSPAKPLLCEINEIVATGCRRTRRPPTKSVTPQTMLEQRASTTAATRRGYPGSALEWHPKAGRRSAARGVRGVESDDRSPPYPRANPAFDAANLASFLGVETRRGG